MVRCWGASGFGSYDASRRTDGDPTGTGDQPGHRVLLEWAARAQAVDPALQRMSDRAQSTEADVSEVPLAGLGRDRVVGSRRRLQLRDAAPTTVPVLRLPPHRRASAA